MAGHPDHHDRTCEQPQSIASVLREQLTVEVVMLHHRTRAIFALVQHNECGGPPWLRQLRLYRMKEAIPYDTDLWNITWHYSLCPCLPRLHRGPKKLSLRGGGGDAWLCRCLTAGSAHRPLTTL